ncbi:unnamed protein product [Lactuca virosa]|uniref:Protein kinase domain-containing protein n=1 Tax=Lactuca virosa TaxID=75947 RepID=A0AAU9NGJ1_9ASTR|nr:unnamed protein product [Lactuca virosa]
MCCFPVYALYRIGYSGDVPLFPIWLSVEAKDLLNKCLRTIIEERWTANQLLQHPFVDSIYDFQKIEIFSKNSPSSILDQGFWDCFKAFEASPLMTRLINFSGESPVVRIRQYEGNSFYNQSTAPGNDGLCGNHTSSRQSVFETTVDGLMSDLSIATPKINGFFAAATTPVIGTNTSTAYAIAQCAISITRDDCRNCLQVAYANTRVCAADVTDGRSVDSGCFMRYSASPFFPNNAIIDITPFLRDGGSSNKGAIIGGVVGVIILLILILLWYRRSRKRTSPGSYAMEAEDLKGAVHYNYNDLQLATNNFGEENILGKGGFGEVFKATLDDKNIVAVKKLHVQHGRVKEEFENEVKLISDIHHRNLLRLLGWSSEGSDLFLVLEYMPNGSLDQFLWGSKRDFGLARFLPEDETHVITKFAGTLGYTAPEYALQGVLSDKVDTYSFGVVILEIISGRRSTEAWKSYEKKVHMEFIDVTLDLNQHQQEHVMKIIEIALLCTQSPVTKRPTMSEVVLMLQDGQSLGKKELTRPTYVHNHERRIHIGSSKNFVAANTICKDPKQILEANEKLRSERADAKVDVLEEGMNVAKIL